MAILPLAVPGAVGMPVTFKNPVPLQALSCVDWKRWLTKR
jgi:hypothetical protein